MAYLKVMNIFHFVSKNNAAQQKAKMGFTYVILFKFPSSYTFKSKKRQWN
jgi:hypothetical protein